MYTIGHGDDTRVQCNDTIGHFYGTIWNCDYSIWHNDCAIGNSNGTVGDMTH